MGKEIRKSVAFSPRIDVRLYHYLAFDLTPLDRANSTIEISVDYGPAQDRPGYITARVWAGIADSEIKHYLFTEYLPLDECALEDYTGIAMRVYKSPSLPGELERFLEWTNRNGLR